MKNWTIKDRAYIAGLLDGEGCFGLYRQTQWQFGYIVAIQLSICSHTIVKYISNLTRQPYYSRKRLPSQKLIYSITWHGPKAKYLITQILPFLKCKKREAQLCLQFIWDYETYRAATTLKRLQWNQLKHKKFMNYCERLCKQVHNLKKNPA